MLIFPIWPHLPFQFRGDWSPWVARGRVSTSQAWSCEERRHKNILSLDILLQFSTKKDWRAVQIGRDGCAAVCSGNVKGWVVMYCPRMQAARCVRIDTAALLMRIIWNDKTWASCASNNDRHCQRTVDIGKTSQKVSVWPNIIITISITSSQL